MIHMEERTVFNFLAVGNGASDTWLAILFIATLMPCFKLAVRTRIALMRAG